MKDDTQKRKNVHNTQRYLWLWSDILDDIKSVSLFVLMFICLIGDKTNSTVCVAYETTLSLFSFVADRISRSTSSASRIVFGITSKSWVPFLLLFFDCQKYTKCSCRLVWWHTCLLTYVRKVTCAIMTQVCWLCNDIYLCQHVSWYNISTEIYLSICFLTCIITQMFVDLCHDTYVFTCVIAYFSELCHYT